MKKICRDRRRRGKGREKRGGERERGREKKEREKRRNGGGYSLLSGRLFVILYFDFPWLHSTSPKSFRTK